MTGCQWEGVLNTAKARLICSLALLVSGMAVGACGGSNNPVEPPEEGGFFRMRAYETLVDPGIGTYTTTVGGQIIKATHEDDLPGAIGVIFGFTTFTNFEGFAISPQDPRLPAAWKFEAKSGPCRNDGTIAETDVYQNSLVTVTCLVWVEPSGDFGILQDGSIVYTGGWDKLFENEILYPWEWRESGDGRMRLTYQGDGNLVLYDNNSPVWSSNTYGISSEYLAMQNDGNLVIYASGGVPVWESNTDGYWGAVVVVQPNRCALMYHGTPYDAFIPWGTSSCEY